MFFNFLLWYSKKAVIDINSEFSSYLWETTGFVNFSNNNLFRNDIVSDKRACHYICLYKSSSRSIFQHVAFVFQNKNSNNFSVSIIVMIQTQIKFYWMELNKVKEATHYLRKQIILGIIKIIDKQSSWRKNTSYWLFNGCLWDFSKRSVRIFCPKDD